MALLFLRIATTMPETKKQRKMIPLGETSQTICSWSTSFTQPDSEDFCFYPVLKNRHGLFVVFPFETAFYGKLNPTKKQVSILLVTDDPAHQGIIYDLTKNRVSTKNQVGVQIKGQTVQSL